MRLESQTLQDIARELLGIEVSERDLEEVVPAINAWQERFAQIRTLDLGVVEPSFLELREAAERWRI